jgi:hypothetical protein
VVAGDVLVAPHEARLAWREFMSASSLSVQQVRGTAVCGCSNHVWRSVGGRTGGQAQQPVTVLGCLSQSREPLPSQDSLSCSNVSCCGQFEKGSCSSTFFCMPLLRCAVPSAQVAQSP